LDGGSEPMTDNLQPMIAEAFLRLAGALEA
jgi:hypothetical protein